MERIVDGTYVINMDKNIDRLMEFDSMMSSANWKYERFRAINGKQLYPTHEEVTLAITELDSIDLQHNMALKNKYVTNFSWLSAGEIGCLLSHVSLWEKVAIDTDKNRIAIFEDDARTHLDGNTIHKHLSEFYQYLTDNKIPEPDILYLGKALDDCINYEKVWGNVYKSKHPLCLHAYIITKQGARKLLELAPYGLAIDVIPIKATQKNIVTLMVFHPSIYFQDIFGNVSDLRHLRFGINTTTECLVSIQHMTDDNLQFTFIVFIGLIVAFILFCLFIFVYK